MSALQDTMFMLDDRTDEELDRSSEYQEEHEFSRFAEVELIPRWMALGYTEDEARDACDHPMYAYEVYDAERSGKHLVNGEWIYRDPEKRERLEWAKGLVSGLDKAQREMLKEALYA
jgi:hypothetical protein